MTPTNTPLNIPLAVGLGLGTVAWYALPDVVRSRAARAMLKTGLVAAGGAAYALAHRPESPQQGPDAFDEVLAAVNEDPGRTLGLLTAVLAGSTALGIAGEKAIFRFGERRRARGVRGAHLVPALGWGVLGALSMLVTERWDPATTA